ncbi:MAG: YvrJ family protein [Bacillota bacterium]|nr:YvrJ family protein [Bacillota bacterium]
MDIVNLIGNVGFPIAVSLYLLVRIEGKLENLTKSINELANVMTKLEKENLKSVR